MVGVSAGGGLFLGDLVAGRCQLFLQSVDFCGLGSDGVLEFTQCRRRRFGRGGFVLGFSGTDHFGRLEERNRGSLDGERFSEECQYVAEEQRSEFGAASCRSSTHVVYRRNLVRTM